MNEMLKPGSTIGILGGGQLGVPCPVRQDVAREIGTVGVTQALVGVPVVVRGDPGTRQHQHAIDINALTPWTEGEHHFVFASIVEVQTRAGQCFRRVDVRGNVAVGRDPKTTVISTAGALHPEQTTAGGRLEDNFSADQCLGFVAGDVEVARTRQAQGT